MEEKKTQCTLILGNGIDYLSKLDPHSAFIVSDPPLHVGIDPFKAIYSAAHTYIVIGGVGLLVPEEKKRIPGEKGVCTYYEILKQFSPRTVIDPFMGTGTTGEAALRAGHKFIGVEIDPKRVKIARDRLLQWM